MQVGDLVHIDKKEYPQYAGMPGLITEQRPPASFVVHINGKEHPFLIHGSVLEVINESR